MAVTTKRSFGLFNGSQELNAMVTTAVWAAKEKKRGRGGKEVLVRRSLRHLLCDASGPSKPYRSLLLL